MKNNNVVPQDVVELKIIMKKKVIRNENVTVVILNDKFKGVARCCEGDIYDAQIGEIIALNRAIIELIENETDLQIARGNRMIKMEKELKRQRELEELEALRANFKIHKGDVLLDSKSDVVAHQVNCRGSMGAGIAKSIRSMYPTTNQIYRDYCDGMIFGSPLGDCLLTKEYDRYIANIFGQDGYNPTSIQTDYRALESGLNFLKEQMKHNGLTSVSFPYMIGCGLAGGDIDTVMDIIKRVFDNTGITVDFYDFN